MLWERQGKGAPALPSETSATPPPEAAPEAGLPEAPKPPKGAAKPAAKSPRTAKPAARAEATGKPLEARGHVVLTAPDAADVYLDGKRIGRGSMRFDVKPGTHKIEVRLGKARVTERFDVAPHETWTYDVTPTK